MAQVHGKSTLAAGIFYFLKTHGYNVELVTEFAKDCVYEKRFDILKFDQLYIFAKQNHKLNILKNYSKNVDFVITDSPLLLSKIFGIYRKNVPNSFLNLVSDVFNSYENINFKLEKTHEYVSFGRIETENEANKIDKLIDETLKNDKLFYEVLKIDKDKHDGIDLVINSKQFKEIIKNVD